MYKRFIDDLIIIWKEDVASLDLFREMMDGNDKNIKLTWTISNECITFLDLDIFKEGRRLFTRNHFKPTDRNSNLSVDSCPINLGPLTFRKVNI